MLGIKCDELKGISVEPRVDVRVVRRAVVAEGVIRAGDVAKALVVEEFPGDRLEVKPVVQSADDLAAVTLRGRRTLSVDVGEGRVRVPRTDAVGRVKRLAVPGGRQRGPGRLARIIKIVVAGVDGV